MKIEIKSKYKEVTAEVGYILTTYKEGDESYNAFATCYCPLNSDLSHISEITLERHTELDEYFKAKEAEYLRKLENDNVRKYD